MSDWKYELCLTVLAFLLYVILAYSGQAWVAGAAGMLFALEATITYMKWRP